jgi:phosphatidylserine/phosphatidylglycerophosphate/cardiolipin synthase-like enzyme
MLRNVSAALFLNVSHRAGDADEIAAEAVAKFIATQWPEASAPLPRFYFDPRTVGSAPYLSLHAKCVVVDSRRALIGSANFTNRGTERNIECGVVVDDSVFAERVRKQWMDMVSRGHAREVPTRAS